MKYIKGDVFAIPLEREEGFIYFQFIAGSKTMGQMLKVFQYVSPNLEKDIQNIISQPSAFPVEYIFGGIDNEEQLIKVGNQKLDYKKILGQCVYTRYSLERNRKSGSFYKELRKDFINEPTSDEWYNSFINYSKKEITHKFEDWCINEYKIVSERGKFEFIGETCVGNLNEEQKKIFLDLMFEQDFISQIINKVDKETALTKIFI